MSLGFRKRDYKHLASDLPDDDIPDDEGVVDDSTDFELWDAAWEVLEELQEIPRVQGVPLFQESAMADFLGFLGRFAPSVRRPPGRLRGVAKRRSE